MREIGFDNFKIVESNTNWMDARKTEGEFIEFFKPTLNSIVTGKYISTDGPFNRKAYGKVYHNENRESHNKKMSEWYQENKHKRRKKVVCASGAVTTHDSVKRHLKT